MVSKTITVLAGDGIGPEISFWAKELILKIGSKYRIDFKFDDQLIGHAAIEKTGNPLPAATLQACKKGAAVLLAAVGDPIYDDNPKAKVRPEQGLLRLRSELDLFSNLRPIQLFPQLLEASSLKAEILRGTDILFCRELTSGIYFGKPRARQDNGTRAIDTMVYTEDQVERIAVVAFQAAQKRRKQVCSIDKANVLETSRLWREVVNRTSQKFPDVELRHLFVDNAAMQLIKNPLQFDVVLTGNMFGDILTDLASQVAGSLGMLPSASIGSKYQLFEPIHGSAPDIAGQDKANPLAMFLSVALMLDLSFDLKSAAEAIWKAIHSTLEAGFRTSDIADSKIPAVKILGTAAIAEKVIAEI